jgi:cytidylate kinase
MGGILAAVVLPDADAKFFIDAAADIRATRRHLELKARGEISNFQKYSQISLNGTAVIKIAQLRR